MCIKDKTERIRNIPDSEKTIEQKEYFKDEKELKSLSKEIKDLEIKINQMKKKKKEDSKNLTKKRNKIITKLKSINNKINYEDIVIFKYNTDSKYKNKFNNLLSINNNNSIMEKCIHSKCVLTKEWFMNKNNNKTPKTDIIIKDSKKNIKISLKKNKGRVTSCGLNETTKLFNNVFNNGSYNDTKLYSNIQKIILNFPNMIYGDGKIKTSYEMTFTKMKKMYKNNREEFKLNYPKEYKWFNKTNIKIKECNKLWNNIYTNNNNFIIDIIIETLTGKLKFGNNIGCAEYLINLDKQLEIKDFIDMKNRDKLKNYITKNVKLKNLFQTKSSGNKNKTNRSIWVRFF